MEQFFGKNWQTSLAGIMMVISAVPQAIQSLDIGEPPQWLRIAGMVCTFISTIYLGVSAKYRNTTGVGNSALTLTDIQDVKKDLAKGK